MNWLRVTQPELMYMVSYSLVGHGLRLQIPDDLPASSEVAASTVALEATWPANLEDTI